MVLVLLFLEMQDFCPIKEKEKLECVKLEWVKLEWVKLKSSLGEFSRSSP